MPDLVSILVAGLFLPLFPMSMVFNAILANVQHHWLRVLLLLAWPLPGLLIVHYGNPVIPDWVLVLALFTSFLYALRLLTLRDVIQWTGFLATSLWSLLWVCLIQGVSSELMYWFAVSISVPMALLVLLCAGLERRFGAAYTDLYGGLARTIPRYAGVLVTVIVAAIATPLFPTFFIMLDLIVETVSSEPLVAVIILLIWLLWSWAGARVIQGLIVGRASKIAIRDMNTNTVVLYSIMLLVLIIDGVYLGGMIL